MRKRFVTRLLAMIEEQRTTTSDDAVGLAETLPPERWAEQWANGALLHARVAYEGLRITDRIGDGKYKVAWEGKAAYDSRCKPVVSAQLASAARNLAALINTILGTEKIAAGV